ncbi:hypothetical protein D3C81_1629720 [compost metagenome]
MRNFAWSTRLLLANRFRRTVWQINRRKEHDGQKQHGQDHERYGMPEFQEPNAQRADAEAKSVGHPV